MTLSESEYANESDSFLFQAIKTQKWSLVERLLEEEPDLTKKPDENGNLPLHSAIGFKCPDQILLKLLYAYPEACQSHGTDDWLPLHIAAMWGISAEVMKALILAYPEGLDDSGQDTNKGRSPRHFSARFVHNKELLERSTEEWKKLTKDNAMNL
mmetsp:Transcript_22271/g.52944  ORF Transcript_22271/g.52944 Transcript_22271/m.52944 type:complete len:155 (-) Transcript_22271:2482-2946(-)